MNEAKMTQLLCAHGDRRLRVSPNKVVWHPTGRVPAVTEALRAHGCTVLATDASGDLGLDGERDFFDVDGLDPSIELIVGVPPLDGVFDFVDHALNLSRKTTGGVLLLMPEEIARFQAFQSRIGSPLYVTRFCWLESPLAWFYWDHRPRSVRVAKRLIMTEAESLEACL